MDKDRLKLLSSLISGRSRSISHIHCYGTSGPDRSDAIRRVVSESVREWDFIFADFLYAGGSLRLLLRSLCDELDVKMKGDSVIDFIYSIQEQYKWKSNRRRLLIFLDNAQAANSFHQASINFFIKSFEMRADFQLRLVTSADCSWECCLSNFSSGQHSSIQFDLKSLNSEGCMITIRQLGDGLNEKFLRFAVETLFPHCRSPSLLLRTVSDAYARYLETQRNVNSVDLSNAAECVLHFAETQIGVASSDKQPNERDSGSEAFQSMPESMRFLVELTNVHHVFRFLLISAFCASNNSTVSDKRFFVKHHGKEKRSEAKELRNDLNRQQRDAEPKAADLQRIFCIYRTLKSQYSEGRYSTFDVKSVLSSLVSMGLLSLSSTLDSPRLRCLISLESATKISTSLGIQLRDYLEYAN